MNAVEFLARFGLKVLESEALELRARNGYRAFQDLKKTMAERERIATLRAKVAAALAARAATRAPVVAADPFGDVFGGSR
jgi:hypothetical protein